jgi:MFS transporter, OFA family, oxalate/formate antiporter
MRWAYGWNIVAVAMVYQAFAYGTIISSFTLFLPFWATDFGIAKSTAAFYVTISTLIGGLAGAAIGRLYDRFSVKLLLLVGAGLYILSYLLLSVTASALQLFFVFSILLSLALLMLSILPSQVLVARWFPEKTSVPISIVATGMAFGGIILPPLVAFLMIELNGWRAACRAMAILMAVVVVPLIILVIRDRPAGSTAARPAGARQDIGSAAARGSIIGDPRFYLAMLTALPLYTIYSGFQANLGPMLLDKGSGLAEVSASLAMLNGASLVASLSAGWLLLRIAHRNLYHAMGLIAMVGVAVFALSSGDVLPLAASALIGLGIGATGAILTAYYFASFGADRMGTVLGYASPFSRIAVFAPPLFAFGREATGGYDAPLIGLGALGLITVLGATLMPRPAAT